MDFFNGKIAGAEVAKDDAATVGPEIASDVEMIVLHREGKRKRGSEQNWEGEATLIIDFGHKAESVFLFESPLPYC